MLKVFVIYFILCFIEIYLSNLLQNSLSFYRGVIDNPSYASDCKYLFFVCRYRLDSVAWFSYWIDNPGFITEGNTYRCCAASSSPLRGNTNADTRNQEKFLALLLRRHHQHLSGTHSQISSPFNLYYLSFASRFHLPHF